MNSIFWGALFSLIDAIKATINFGRESSVRGKLQKYFSRFLNGQNGNDVNSPFFSV